MEKILRAWCWMRAIRTSFSVFSLERRPSFLRWSLTVRGEIPRIFASSSTVTERTFATPAKAAAGRPVRIARTAWVVGILATWNAVVGMREVNGNIAGNSSKTAGIPRPSGKGRLRRTWPR